MTARWVAACALAEAVGMSAAAVTARAATSLADSGVAAGWNLAVVIFGDLVEGTALGLLQAASLPFGLSSGSAARRWAAVTVAVAGVGWAVASAPPVLAGDDGSAAPPSSSW